jgi:hypothetical protein
MELSEANAGSAKQPQKHLSPGSFSVQTDARGPLAKLPIEWLVQVIYWLPTQFIFTIMCVNREWECACRYVLKWRESLEVSCRPGDVKSHHLVLLNPKDWNEERAAQILSSLKLMENLTHVSDFTDGATSPIRKDWLQAIAVQNALTLVSMKRHQLPDDGSVMYKKLKKLDCATFDATSAGRLCPVLQNLRITRRVLGQNYSPLPSLKVVTTHWGKEGIPQFLGKSAASLETISFKQLPACRFPKLKVLTTDNLPQESQVPSLQSLALHSTTLPDDQNPSNFFLNKLIQISVTVNNLEQASLSQAITWLSAMENMTSLFLQIKCNPPQDPVPDLFANMHRLKKVSISIGPSSDEPGRFLPAQGWASSLFTKNHNLSDLFLRGIPVTDEDLVLCSRLRNLTKVNLGNNEDHGFTVTGIIALLRGASRTRIAEFFFTMDQNRLHIIDSEIKEMEKERSVSFTREVRGRFSPFSIRFQHGPHLPHVVTGDGPVPSFEETIQTQIKAIMTRQRRGDDEWMITKARGSLADSFLSIPESHYVAETYTRPNFSVKMNVVQEEMVFFLERRNVPGQLIPIAASYCIF